MHAAADIALGDGNDQTEVCLGKALTRIGIALAHFNG